MIRRYCDLRLMLQGLGEHLIETHFITAWYARAIAAIVQAWALERGPCPVCRNYAWSAYMPIAHIVDHGPNAVEETWRHLIWATTKPMPIRRRGSLRQCLRYLKG